MDKWLIYSICILSLALLEGCGDLEEDLTGEITEDLRIPSPYPPEVVIDVLGSAYYGLRYIGMANHGAYFSIQELPSDEMFIGIKGTDWAWDEGLINLHRHHYTPANDFINRSWINLYEAIDVVNDRLDSSWIDEEDIPEYKALRAYYYMCLMDLFGRVKIVTESDPNPPQSSREEVFAFVEQELLTALDLEELSPMMDLSESPLDQEGNQYRINQYGALGLLAKLYLNAEVYAGEPMYDKAEIAASYVIDSGTYQLCGEGCRVRNLGRRQGVASDPEHLEGYAAVFAPNNEDNPEHIFTINYDEVRHSGMNFSQMNLHYASQLSWHLSQQPWNGYATLEEFYNAYEETDARKKANFLTGPQLDFSGSALLDYNTDDGNPVLNYTPALSGIHTTREAGARANKFSLKLFGRPDMNNDFPVIRLGELYLIRAEAKARLSGNWTDAETDINVLRARAGVAGYSGNLTAEEFLAERGREMFHETVRRTDLIRFGKYNEAWWEKPASAPFRNVFPIPLEQLNADPGLSQNPGY